MNGTKNALMWLHYCLAGEKKKKENVLLSN
jgi:hypothetical protein